jgi:preprotein translocase subunit SecA
MDKLEKIWENTSSALQGMLSGIERGITGIFGSSNARQIKRYQSKISQINALETKFESLSDTELRDMTAVLRKRLASGETLDDILVDAFAVCREGGKRFLKMRHYDVQLIGGMVLHGGNIAEMVTGEGKTLVATLPTYLNALGGKVHVVTVNDYLARRDMEWMGPLYMGLGLTVGSIQSQMSNDARQKSYACDITYGTNNEFGFDYLRDNMRQARLGDQRFPLQMQQVQGPLDYAVIDEVDNILIDEARTPLIISGPAHQDVKKYTEADRIAKSLKVEQHFTVNEKDHTVNLTDEGVRMAEKLAGVESFYTAGNMEWPHMIDNALKAHYLYKRDVNYVVKEGAIVIVDEFTGRLMEGRQWSDGLHQSVEAKEGVRIKEETQTLATITLQNFFKLYKKLSGMTGTAMTEANEFYKIYGLDVVAIPTNRSMQRIEFPDMIFLTEKEKYQAVADEIESVSKWDSIQTKDGKFHDGEIVSDSDTAIRWKEKGQKDLQEIPRSNIKTSYRRGRPVLVGTVSIEKSERLSKLLEQRGIPHQVLNAKNHEREAEIIAQAGRVGAVTIATNMAGRGTDIILGGNPETMAWARLQHTYPTRLDVPREVWDSLVHEIEQKERMKEQGEFVRSIGGLYVVGTERHESRRIDLQLRGRCGRQGDPGTSRFFLSLEDDLMRIFAGDWVRNMMGKLGMGDGEPIESSFVSKRISAAQKKVEERHFDIRKNLLEFDEVMDQQRKRVYSYRQRILDGTSCREIVLEQIRDQIHHNVDQFTDPMFGPESFARWAGPRLGCQLDAKDFRTTDAEAAIYYAKDMAERAAETQILDSIDENLPSEEEESEWNWEALVNFANSRFGTQLRASELKKAGRDRVDEFLLERIREKIGDVDLLSGAPLLQEAYGMKMLCEWMANKFGIQIAPSQCADKEPKELKEMLYRSAEEAYRAREVSYPVMAGLMNFRVPGQSQETTTIRAPEFFEWAANRFDDPSLRISEIPSELSLDGVHAASERSEQRSKEVAKESHEVVAKLFSGAKPGTKVSQLPQSQAGVEAFRQWMHQSQLDLPEGDQWLGYDEQEVRRMVREAIDERYYPEIRRMERQVLLNIVDGAWKDHLLAMDHLRSAISLKSYAQMDPKVEYKREGMRMYGQMWFSIGEQMTDIIFRMEGLSEDFVGSTFVETSARHDTPQSTADLARQVAQAEAAAARGQAAPSASSSAQDSDPPIRLDPIRNMDQRVGRNDPCPCGSGKKYKNCCLRNP